MQELVSSMAQAADDFLNSLSAIQREKAHYPPPGATEERFRWWNAPQQQGGLPLAEMDPQQRRLAHRLLATGLSAGGHTKAMHIMAHEDILDRFEDWNLSSPILTTYPGRPWHKRGREPLLYFISVFGGPGDDVWGWRANGHHLSVNYSIVDGAIANLPIFFGAAPSSVPQPGEERTFKLLGPEEDLGFELVGSLDPSQRDAAVLAPVPPVDVTQPNRKQVKDDSLMDPHLLFSPGTFDEGTLSKFIDALNGYASSYGWNEEHASAVAFTLQPKGLSAADMNDGQRERLRGLLRRYVDRMPDVVAERHEKLIEESLMGLHFAWAGQLEPGSHCYYRVQGGGLLVEYANVQWDANHAHSLWRDPNNDFGRELLNAHYATHEQDPG